jgi:hypothetical protein
MKSATKVRLLFFFIFLQILVDISAQATKDITSLILQRTISGEVQQIIFDFKVNSGHFKAGLPLLERIEFRTETDRMSFGRQEFLVRTTFNTPGMQKAAEERLHSQRNLRILELEEIQRQTLLSRYKELINAFGLIQHLQSLRQIQVIQQDYLRQLEKILSTGIAGDPIDYLKIKRSILETNVKSESTSNEFGKISFVKDSTIFESENPFEQMITVEKIKELLQNFRWTPANHHSIEQKLAQIDVLQKNIAYENARSARIIDFTQARYTVREDLLFENRFSLSLGLQFPWRGTGKSEINELRARVAERNAEAELIRLQLEEKSEQAKDKVLHQINLYEKLATLIRDDQLAAIESNINKFVQLTPEQQYRLKMEKAELLKSLAEIEIEILESYLDFLHTTGLIYQRPYRNYLHLLTPFLE